MAASNNNFLPLTEIPYQDQEMPSSSEADQPLTRMDTTWMDALRRLKDDINSPTKRERLVLYLNKDDRFRRHLMIHAVEDREKPLTRILDKHAVLHGMLGMELGLAIGIEDLEFIHSALKRMDLPQKDKERIEKDLKYYKDNQGSSPHSTSVPIHGRNVPVEEAKEKFKPFQTLMAILDSYEQGKEEKAMKENDSGPLEVVEVARFRDRAME